MQGLIVTGVMMAGAILAILDARSRGRFGVGVLVLCVVASATAYGWLTYTGQDPAGALFTSWLALLAAGLMVLGYAIARAIISLRRRSGGSAA